MKALVARKFQVSENILPSTFDLCHIFIYKHACRGVETHEDCCNCWNSIAVIVHYTLRSFYKKNYKG